LIKNNAISVGIRRFTIQMNKLDGNTATAENPANPKSQMATESLTMNFPRNSEG
jgi:hypothetical protein